MIFKSLVFKKNVSLAKKQLWNAVYNSKIDDKDRLLSRFDVKSEITDEWKCNEDPRHQAAQIGHHQMLSKLLNVGIKINHYSFNL